MYSVFEEHSTEGLTEDATDSAESVERRREEEEALRAIFGDDAVAAPVLPTENRPTLQEYQSKWRTKLAQHAREVDGPFSKDNLCPKPVHQLWQDCGRLMRLDRFCLLSLAQRF